MIKILITFKYLNKKLYRYPSGTKFFFDNQLRRPVTVYSAKSVPEGHTIYFNNKFNYLFGISK